MRPIEFWYDFASPYAWLAAMRIGALAPDAAWKPFLLGPVLRQLSAGGSPWQQVSAPERRYRRRDIERQAAGLGLGLPAGSLLEQAGMPETKAALAWR